MTYVVHVCHDSETGRYYVDSSDIPGLHVEADTFEEFVNIVQDVAPDLLGEAARGSEISFQ
jgi:predicted RNase H-like HicB family nuclease